MRLLKFLLFFSSTLLCALGAALFSLTDQTRSQILTARLLTLWARTILKLFRISVHERPSFNTQSIEAKIIVSNHMSYLDIPILLSRGSSVFLAKKEVSQWPLIGFIARKAGVIFVDRNNLNSRADSILKIQAALRCGLSVVVFPEGTTSENGPRRGENFYNGAFRAAREEKKALEVVYLNFDQVSRCAWLGSDKFISHLWRFLSGGPVRVSLKSSLIETIQDRSHQSRISKESRQWIVEGGSNLNVLWG